MTTTLDPTREQPASPTRAKTARTGRPRALSAWGWGAVGILLLAIVWELYKFLGPPDGVVIGGRADPAAHDRPRDAARLGHDRPAARSR